MSALSDIVAALGGLWNGSGGAIARCPCHADDKPSLSIGEGRDGMILLHCFAGCSQATLVEEMHRRGLTLDGNSGTDRRPRYANGANGTARSPNNGRLAARRVIATYDYEDESGQLIHQVQRWAPKVFRQRRPDGNGGWIDNIDGVDRLPYRLPQMLAAPEKPVFVVEGEKDADRLAREGLVATTNSGGAGSTKVWSSLAHWFADRTVFVLPDNDKAGRKHAANVARRLAERARRVRIVELPDLPPKGDVSDWLAHHLGRQLQWRAALAIPVPGNRAPAAAGEGARQE